MNQAELLTEEVRSWGRKVKMPLGKWSTRSKEDVWVASEKAFKGSEGLILNGIQDYWGWLSAVGMEPEGDNWGFYFSTNLGPRVRTDGFTWLGGVLPKAWGGELFSHLQTRDFVNEQVNQTEGSHVLVGRFDDNGQEGFWGTTIEGMETPIWPHLVKGETGNLRVDEMEFLGVLRRAGKVGRKKGGWREGFYVAWGDLQGNCLGWEKVSDMATIHLILPGRSYRYFSPLPDWEEVELKLRDGSWGREL